MGPVRYLADYIDLIEINSTFYRPPSADVAKKWAARAQDLDGFRYSAKLYRRFTHDRDTAWKAAELKEAKAGLKVLNKAGVLDALLMQFPWSFRNTEENREWLGDLVDAFGEFPLVVEVRHEGWNNAEFYESLAESGVGFVNVDQPLFKKSIKPSALATSRIGYVRVHGRNYSDWFRKGAGRDARYDYLYKPAELKPWVERTEEVAEERGTEDVDVVFNNHYKAQAVVNAIQFKSMLLEEKVEAPPLLEKTYPAALKKFAIKAKREVA